MKRRLILLSALTALLAFMAVVGFLAPGLLAFAALVGRVHPWLETAVVWVALAAFLGPLGWLISLPLRALFGRRPLTPPPPGADAGEIAHYREELASRLRKSSLAVPAGGGPVTAQNVHVALARADREVRRRIKRAATLAGGMTAIGQSGRLDMLVTLGVCARLFYQVCEVYGVRPGPAQTLAMAWRALTAGLFSFALEEIPLSDYSALLTGRTLRLVPGLRSAAAGLSNASLVIRLGLAVRNLAAPAMPDNPRPHGLWRETMSILKEALADVAKSGTHAVAGAIKGAAQSAVPGLAASAPRAGVALARASRLGRNGDPRQFGAGISGEPEHSATAMARELAEDPASTLAALKTESFEDVDVDQPVKARGKLREKSRRFFRVILWWRR